MCCKIGTYEGPQVLMVLGSDVRRRDHSHEIADFVGQGSPGEEFASGSGCLRTTADFLE